MTLLAVLRPRSLTPSHHEVYVTREHARRLSRLMASSGRASALAYITHHIYNPLAVSKPPILSATLSPTPHVDPWRGLTPLYHLSLETEPSHED